MIEPEWIAVIKPGLLLLFVLVGIPIWLRQERVYRHLSEKQPELFESFGRPTLSNPGSLRQRLRFVCFYWSRRRVDKLNDPVLRNSFRFLRSADVIGLFVLLAYFGVDWLSR